jgi:predicted dehydrogenase
LARFLLDDPVSICAHTNCFFWGFPVVEDNAFCMMKFPGGQIAQIHISWTQWLNVFDFEIFGHDGFLRLEGRDGHYGPQKLTWGKRKPDHGRPQLQVFDFPAHDDSWDLEWRDFVSEIRQCEQTNRSGEDGLRAQTLIECAYRSAVENSWIAVPEYGQAQKGAAG